MATLAQNFKLLADLHEDTAVLIQSALRLIDDNTNTKVTLKNLNKEKKTVDFVIEAGSINDLKQACDYKGITIKGSTLSV